MDAPQIRYAKTTDGVSIAYCTAGTGPPLVLVQIPYSNVEFEWRISVTRPVYDAIAVTGMLVRYDHRGFGLSERLVTAFSLDTFVLDLEAVIHRLHLDRFRLVAGDTWAAPIAFAYAARHPKQVSHLLSQDALLRPTAESESFYSRLEALVGVSRDDWNFASESAMRLMMGWENDASAREMSQLMRRSVSQDTLLAFIRVFRGWDLLPFLSELTMPVLLLHNVGDPVVSLEDTREMASALPDARVAVIESPTPEEGLRQRIRVAGEFLFATERRRIQAGPTRAPSDSSGTAIILFADIADSTALTERLGDAAFRAKARELDGALRGIIRDNAGTPIEGKLLGDGVLAVFTSARQAIEAALACGKAGEDATLPLHLGLHAGDVIREEGNVYGGAVNIAARISGLSAPGEVLVSDVVRTLARTSAGVRFEDQGEQALKGVGEPVRVWVVRQGEAS